MTFDGVYNAFDAIIRDVQSEPFGNIMVQIGVTATTLIRERVKKTGETAEGGKFPPYSTKPMLSGCSNMNLDVCERLIGSKPKRKDKKWVTLNRINKRTGKKIHLFEIPGGYKEFRELHGRQTAFVDFAFNNRMWENIKLVSSNSEHNQGIARIAATTPEDKKKLEGNTKRKGDILKLSQSELGELTGIFNIGLTQILEKHGLK